MYVERNEKAEFSAAKTEMGEEEERGEEGSELSWFLTRGERRSASRDQAGGVA